MDEGLSDSKIAQKLGMEITSVKRAIIYVNELAAAELSTKEIAAKRADLYMELTEAAIEARKLFNKFKEFIPCKMCNGTGSLERKGIIKSCTYCKGMGGYIKAGDAKKFFDAWMDSTDRRMKLYGLDNNKGGDLVFNQQINNQYVPPDKVDFSTGDKIAKAMKSSHETRIQDKYEKDREY